ncbi:MAG: hypothetical protein ACLRXC_11930 [[Clostridium] leptum]
MEAVGAAVACALEKSQADSSSGNTGRENRWLFSSWLSCLSADSVFLPLPGLTRGARGVFALKSVYGFPRWYILAQIAGKPEKAFLALWPHRNILAGLDFIPHFFEGMKNCLSVIDRRMAVSTSFLSSRAMWGGLLVPPAILHNAWISRVWDFQ